MKRNFQQAAQDYLDRQLLTAGSVRVYTQHQQRACAGLGRLSVERIQRQDVERTLAEAASEGLAPSTVKGLLTFIRAVLRDAGNGAANGLSVKVPDTKVRAMSDEEAAAFRAALPDTLYGKALLVLLRTGLREAELLSLDRNAYAPLSQQAHVVGKGGKARVVDVPDDAVEAVNVLVRGPHLCTRQLRRVMAATCTAAGIAQFRVHDLRHTRITHQLLAGVPVLYVSSQAGHSSPSYSMAVYGHLLVASRSQRRAWANA